MAGAYWHFYTANLALEKLEMKLESSEKFRCMLDHRDLFLAGVQGPDFNFYPKGNLQISQLAHGAQPADLGRSMLKHAQTDKEKAFAYGWLMHLTTDNITHPLVNTLILKYFPTKTANGTDPGSYLLGHHRVEWGIDVSLLQNDIIKPYLPELESVLLSALDQSTLTRKALKDVFEFECKIEDWHNSINSMIKYLSFFDKVWAITGRFNDKNIVRRAVKNFCFHILVTPIAKAIARRNPNNGAGVFIPIRPGLEDVDAVLQHADKVCPVFMKHLDEDFISLPNDTG